MRKERSKMAEFKRCEYCHQVIKPEDDAVVCPDCGSPYHRECYLKNGRCVHEDKHASGWTYTPEQETHENPNVLIQCPNCGSANPLGMSACRNCHAPLPFVQLNNPSSEPQQPPQYGGQPFSGGAFGFDPVSAFMASVDMNEELDDGVTVKDVSEYLGQNKLYFLPKFIYMKKNNKSVSWNWSATFFGYLYLFYRKLPIFAIALLLLSLMLDIPGLVLNVSYLAQAGYIEQSGIFTNALVSELEVIAGITSWASTIIQILVGLFFNKFYMEYVIRKVRKIRASVTCDEEFSAVVAKRGGVIKPVTVTVSLIAFSLLMSAVYYLLLLY